MYKLFVEALCSCKYAKSAVTRHKTFKYVQRSYCVRRYSRKLNSSRYTMEDSEFQGEQKYGSQTRSTRAFKPPKTWSKEYNNPRYEKYARQTDNNDNNGNYETTSDDDNDTFGDGVGIFQEISKENKKSGNSSGNSLKKKRNWSNEFGTLVNDEKELLAVDENDISDVEGDDEEEKILNHFRLSRYNRRHIPDWYARKIQKFGKQGEIKKAIEVFDEWMIKNDRVKPTSFEYAVLLKLLADVGYTEKAFSLYKNMLRRRIYPDDHIYTCLFNACANSPLPGDGLRRAKYLRHHMLFKDRKPTYITYLSMIKAFGFCGDINMAFNLADEAALIHIDEQLLNNMLTACISDKEAGFRHAIVVWRKFRTFGIKPNLKSYNLLLRSVAECGVGDPELVKRLFNQPINFIDKKSKVKKKKNLIEGKKRTTTDVAKTNANYSVENARKNLLDSKLQRFKRESFAELDQLMARYDIGTEAQDQEAESIDAISDISKEFDSDTVAFDNKSEWWQHDIFENSVSALAVQKTEVSVTNVSNNTLYDILDPNEEFKCLIDVGAIKDKYDRLGLLGGMNGILLTLEEKKMKPDIVTFTLLSSSIPADHDYVNLLISKMWGIGVKPDVVFYNHCFRLYTAGKRDIAFALYKRMITEELTPDVRTFSILAYACEKRHEGRKLIDDMLDTGLMPNTHTIAALLNAAYLNFEYKTMILKRMSELGIQCGSKTVSLLEKDIQRARSIILKQERECMTQELTDEKKKELAERTQLFTISLDKFLYFYENWLKRQKLAVEPHPWQGFRPEKVE